MKNKIYASTGSCASAAAKAAAINLFFGRKVADIEIDLPGGNVISLPIKHDSDGCYVIKPYNDDPDITKGIKIYAKASFNKAEEIDDGVIIDAGVGIGTVTKPGLAVSVGKPAINPVPLIMIKNEVSKVLPDNCNVKITISAPIGKKIAPKTFNERLGIVGGISILGTEGLVKPMSLDAFKTSLAAQIDIAIASGYKHLAITPGNIGQRAALGLGFNEEAIIICSNYIGYILKECARRGIDEISLVGHLGKLLKVAEGHFNTHSKENTLNFDCLSPFLNQEKIKKLNTAQEAIDLLDKKSLDKIAAKVSQKASEYLYSKVEISTYIINLSSEIVGTDGRQAGTASDLREDLMDQSDLQTTSYKLQADKEINDIWIIGVGPGSKDYLTQAAINKVKEQEILVGSQKALSLFEHLNKKTYEFKSDLDDLVKFLENNHTKAKIAILVTGDPGLYSLAGYIRKNFKNNQTNDLIDERRTINDERLSNCINIIPGISSTQLFFARLGISYEDVKIVSAHGRDLEAVIEKIKNSDRICILCDPKNNPKKIAQALIARNHQAKAWVGQNLSMPNEKITEGDLKHLSKKDKHGNCLLYLERHCETVSKNPEAISAGYEIATVASLPRNDKEEHT